MRGFLGGVVIGGVFAVAGVVALSLFTPVAPVPEVRSDAPTAGTATPPGDAASGVSLSGRDPQVVEVAPTAPVAAAPAQPAGSTDTETASKPVVADVPETPAGQTSGATGAGVDVKSESGVVSQTATPPPPVPATPVAPSVAGDAPARPVTAEVAAPATPAEAAGAPIVTGSAEPAPTQGSEVPKVAAPSGDPAPAIAPEAVVRPEPSSEDRTAAIGNTGQAAPPAVAAITESDPSATAPQVATPAGDPAPQVATDTAERPASGAAPSEAAAPGTETAASTPGIAPAPDVAEAPPAIAAPAESDAPIAVPESDAPPAQSPETPASSPRVAALPSAETGAEETVQPRIGKRVVPLTERNSAPEAAVPAAEAATDPDAPPLTRFAAAFDNPEGKPLMAIVLIDDEKSIGVEALAEFPYPLTFAIDPTAPDAAAKMARHRAAGFEVVALVDLPPAATAQDAEVALTASFARLPEALAVLEGTGTGVQGSRPVSDQVTAFAGASGRGVITQGNGLNTMQKLAVRDRVPAAAVFRDFDGAGQTPAVMRRFLDQAAFRAGQEGAVVMLGRVRPDTVSALLIWGLQDRATRVALAPVSAVLKASVAAE